MKPFPVSKLILFPLLALVVAQFACNLGAQSPSANPQPEASLPAPSASAPSAPGNSNAGQIVISGAVNETFTPTAAWADIPGGVCVYINLIEQGATDGVWLEFPPDTQPGTYPLEGGSCTSSTGNQMDARYTVPGDNAPSYQSANGTLTLTSVSLTSDPPTFSGQFQFTAVDRNDASKTIEVSGSFTDVPFIP